MGQRYGQVRQTDAAVVVFSRLRWNASVVERKPLATAFSIADGLNVLAKGHAYKLRNEPNINRASIDFPLLTR